MLAKIILATLLIISQEGYSQSTDDDLIRPTSRNTIGEREVFLAYQVLRYMVEQGRYVISYLVTNLMAPVYAQIRNILLMLIGDGPISIMLAIAGNVVSYTSTLIVYMTTSVLMIPWLLIRAVYNYYSEIVQGAVKNFREFLRTTFQGTLLDFTYDTSTFLTEVLQDILVFLSTGLYYLTFGLGEILYGIGVQLGSVLFIPIANLLAIIAVNLGETLFFIPLTLNEILLKPLSTLFVGIYSTLLPIFNILYLIIYNLLTGNIELVTTALSQIPYYLLQVLLVIPRAIEMIFVNLATTSELPIAIFNILVGLLAYFRLLYDQIVNLVLSVPNIFSLASDNLYAGLYLLTRSLGLLLYGLAGDVGTMFYNGAMGLYRTLSIVPELLYNPISSIAISVYYVLDAILVQPSMLIYTTISDLLGTIYSLFTNSSDITELLSSTGINILWIVFALPGQILFYVLLGLYDGIGVLIVNSLYHLYLLLRYIIFLEWLQVYNNLFDISKSLLLLLTDIYIFVSSRLQIASAGLLVTLESLFNQVLFRLTRGGVLGLVTIIYNGFYYLGSLLYLLRLHVLPVYLLNYILLGLNAILSGLVQYIATGAMQAASSPVIMSVVNLFYYLGFGLTNTFICLYYGLRYVFDFLIET